MMDEGVQVGNLDAPGVAQGGSSGSDTLGGRLRLSRMGHSRRNGCHGEKAEA